MSLTKTTLLCSSPPTSSQDSITIRLKGVHFLCQPWYISLVLTIVKPFMKEKLRQRVRIEITKMMLFLLSPFFSFSCIFMALILLKCTHSWIHSSFQLNQEGLLLHLKLSLPLVFFLMSQWMRETELRVVLEV